jgi:ethanolamine utilization protein EutN
MKIGRVIGDVLATVKHPALFAHRLLLVDYEKPDGSLAGRPQLALDVVDAGEGDRVLVVDEGNAAAQVLSRPRGPVRTVVVGVVDEVDVAVPSDDRPAPRGRRKGGQGA